MPPGSRGGGLTPPASIQRMLWPEAGSLLNLRVLHRSTQSFVCGSPPPMVLKAAFTSLLPRLYFCNSPYLESPPCSSTNANPTSLAEGWMQNRLFSSLYQSLGILGVLLCNSTRMFYLPLYICYLLPLNSEYQPTTSSPWHTALL